MGYALIDNLGALNIAEDLTAQPSDCLVGYSAIFKGSDGQVKPGTMINSTGNSQVYDCQNTSQQIKTVIAGYHDGTEKISVNPIPKTISMSNTYILKNKKAYVSNGNGTLQLVTGTAGR